jgi:hypothetical protein
VNAPRKVLLFRTAPSPALETYLAARPAGEEVTIVSDVAPPSGPAVIHVEAPEGKLRWWRLVRTRLRREDWSEVVLLRPWPDRIGLRPYILAALAAPRAPLRLHDVPDRSRLFRTAAWGALRIALYRSRWAVVAVPLTLLLYPAALLVVGAFGLLALRPAAGRRAP